MQQKQEKIDGLFRLVGSQQLAQVQPNQTIYRLEVSLNKFGNHTHKLILTKKRLFLKILQIYQSQQVEPLVYCADLDFQINFQIQSALQTNNSLEKIGVRLFKGSEIQNCFYSYNEMYIAELEFHLTQLIHKKGFHQIYVPVEKLGKGHFATVYRVQNVKNGHNFAVKAFSKESTYSAERGKQCLINQLQVMRQVSLSSKNLLNLYEVYQSPNSIYAIQDLLLGNNLAKFMQEKPAGLSYHEAKVVMMGILNGIKAMHERKIMHRDLKPENIVFRTAKLSCPEHYDPVIVDYGMATRSDLQKYIFYRCGTPGYIAPQVINLQVEVPYSVVCDMFSIGCLFHLIMTGFSLFTQINDTLLLLKQNKQLQFQIRSRRVNSCHPFAMDLLLRLIERTPSKRITAQQAILHDFFNEGLLTGDRKSSNSSFEQTSNILKKSSLSDFLDYFIN